MARYVRQRNGQRAGRLLGTAAAVALLALTATPAAAADEPRLSVSALGPTKVSLLVTGFARGATVDVAVAVGGCAGHSSVVASTDAVVADFVTAPPCTGLAVATATAGALTATTSFVFGTPPTAGPGVTEPGPPAEPPVTVPPVPVPSPDPALVPPPGPAPVPLPGTAPDAGSGLGSATAPSTATPSTATPSTTAPSGVPVPGPAGDGQPGRRPVAARCTVQADGGGLPAVRPGDTVCFRGSLPRRLEITQSGTPADPITYSGMGSATVPGITARASNVVVEGFVSRGANDNGFYVSGNGITVRDNDISQVNITDDDVDAIRFFGDGITIAHNDAHDIWANPQAGGDPHTDCMQTYAHSEPASSNVRIEANRCASPQFHQCLMAEGPHDVEDGASGVGNSANWLVTGNYFECHAQAQTVALQDIHNVTFSANDFAGSGDKAIALQKDATGATVAPDNTKGPGYRELVGIDDDSARQGYRGPDN